MLDFINFKLNQPKIKKIILVHAIENNSVIYGRRALNIQMPLPLQSQTQDYDIYDKNPRATANFIQNKLDQEIGMGKDVFFMKPAIHAGTYKVKHVGIDGLKNTSDDVEVADYTKMPKRIKVVVVKKVRYEHVDSIKEGKKKILKDKESEYRHHKDKSDLRKIKARRLLS
jgi:hypothetical protein